MPSPVTPKISLGTSTKSLLAIALISLIGCGGVTSPTAHPALSTNAPTTPSSPGDSVATAPAPISPTQPNATPSFFGLTVLNYENVTPRLTFGTTRTWDAYPALDWAEANPAPGQYNFAPLNSFLDKAQSTGKEVVYTFGRTPQWASTKPSATGPYGPGQCAPPVISAWDQYVTAVVTNAAGRIKYWELWNEPDQQASYCGDMPSMVTMAQHAYAIIKNIDPSATVLSPSATGETGSNWFNSFVTAGGLHTFDVIAFHGYQGAQAEQVTAVVADFRSVMSRQNLSNLPLWDTECSWGNTDVGDDSYRAAFVAKYFFLQWSEGVERVIWYAYDSDPMWGRLIDSTGSLLPDGIAYGESYRWIVGATLTQACAQDLSGTWTCTIERPGGYQAEIMWNSTESIDVKAPPQMTEFRSLDGGVNPIGNGTVSIQNLPILLETGPIPQS